MSYDDKKGDGIHTETIQDDSQRTGDLTKDDSSEEIIMDAGKRRMDERRLVRKLDMRLMPMIFLIFIMNYIDVNPCFYL